MSVVNRIRQLVFDDRAFERVDETDDAAYYAVDRMVPHLDAEARRVVTAIIDGLVVETRPVVLDLMASWDSHLPKRMEPSRIVGLGLNANELEANPVLNERVIHDLNRDPELPFPDASFDVVLNVVSVDYLTRPFEVVDEVARVLRPGGLFLVLFSNRFFPEKVTRVWREASEQERLIIVEDFLGSTALFEPCESTVVKGRPRPADDRYSGRGLPSDPISAVWAEKAGGSTDRPPRRLPELDPWFVRDRQELQRRQASVKATGCCPYCDTALSKWAVPQTPFTEWDEEYMYICFNDECPYLMRGWSAMERQGNHGFSYRLMYSPGRDRCLAVPVPSLKALRESIVETGSAAR